MKRAIPLTLCALLLLASFAGCVVVNLDAWGGQTVTGQGEKESYEIAVGAYTRIRVAGSCDVSYYAAPSNTVTLEIQPNLREIYVVEVRGVELVVEPKSGYHITTNRGNTPTLTISTPSLERLSISGACNFTAHDTLAGDEFTLNLSGAGSGSADLDVNSVTLSIAGAGSFTLSGRADSADFEISGAGDLYAMSLATREAKVRLSGAGTMRINCSGTLRGSAHGVGTIEYTGSCTVDVDTAGMASVKRVGAAPPANNIAGD